MMSDVAEPTDPHSRRPSDSAAPEDAPERAPEIIDAEVVDTDTVDPDHEQRRTPRDGRTSAGGPAGPEESSDSEAFRQYQQFLEFQKFQEWQRRHGDAAPPPGAPASPSRGRPWWKRSLRLLRFKLVRRLLYLLLILLLAAWFVDRLDGPDRGATGGGGPGSDQSSVSAALPDSPSATVRAVYQYIGTGDVDVACALFTDSGKAAFANAHGAESCASAGRALYRRVTDQAQYKRLRFGGGAVTRVKSDASVSSCDITLRGGPRLGKFGLHLRPGSGWIIDNYEPAGSCAP